MPGPMPLRQVTVRPLDGRREFFGLLATILAITILMAVRVAFLPKQDVSLFLKPYQRLDTTLNDQERALYQSLLSCQADVVALWQNSSASEQKWPTVALLSEEGIPPFAQDMVPPQLSTYSWKTIDRGPWVDYLGHDQSDAPGSPSVILRIIDLHAEFHPHPHPGKDYDPNQQTALQIWFHPENKQRYPGMQLIERGWFWILSPNDPFLNPAD